MVFVMESWHVKVRDLNEEQKMVFHETCYCLTEEMD